MLTNNEIKRIKSLQSKKRRNEHNQFIAEGEKNVLDLLSSGLKSISIYSIFPLENTDYILISSKEMERISHLKNYSPVLGVFELPNQSNYSTDGLIFALDSISDPGNLGTIIRLSDWYDIKTIICSSSTVDCYNPKVVQSTMGSIARVNCIYTDLYSFLDNTNKPIYGAALSGDSVYSVGQIRANAILVMGNEANGISKEIESKLNHQITIPKQRNGAESLNVSIATAIILGQLFRP